MKNTKNIVIVVLAFVVLAVLIAVGAKWDRFKEPLIPNRPGATEGTQTTDATETTGAAEDAEPEESVPGAEDSEFEYVPVVTVPQEQGGNNNQTGNSEKPDTPPVQGGNVSDNTPGTPGNTTPTDPSGDDSDPTEPPQQETDPVSQDEMDYRTFQDMTPDQQQAYMESFPSIDEFFDWYEQAKKEYEEANPPIEVGDGNIDLGDLPGGNG